MPLLSRKTVLAAKIETTYGTAISLSGGDAALIAFDAKMQPVSEKEERRRQSAFSRHASVPGARSGRLTFSLDLTGDGAGGIPAWASVFLPACGWVATSQVYSPVTAPVGSGGVKSLTIALYQDGRVKKLVGAVGTFSIRLLAGKKAMIDFEFVGKWVAPADASILAPTYPSNLAIRYANSATTVGSFHPKVSAWTIEARNQLVMRPDAEDSSATGYVGGLITDRMAGGHCDPEANLVATKDLYGEWLSMAEAALSITLGATGNQVVIAAPKLQWNMPQDEDMDDILRDGVDFDLNGSASAGDDELTLTFA